MSTVHGYGHYNYNYSQARNVWQELYPDQISRPNQELPMGLLRDLDKACEPIKLQIQLMQKKHIDPLRDQLKQLFYQYVAENYGWHIGDCFRHCGKTGQVSEIYRIDSTIRCKLKWHKPGNFTSDVAICHLQYLERISEEDIEESIWDE